MSDAEDIKAESWWQREQVGANLTAFGVRLRGHYGVAPAAFGTVGNTAHLVGRHRSLEWNLYSQFASRRNYGTTDPRDRNGNWRLIRAFDLSLPRSALFEVSRNVERAVLHGRAYMLAEWYGDLGDDSLVDGWFEGRDSTSDSSHKTHFHGGLWTIYADDAAALNDLFNIMTGGDDVTPDDIRTIVRQVVNALAHESTDEGFIEADQNGDVLNDRIRQGSKNLLPDLGRKLDQLLARPAATVDAKALAVELVALGVSGATPAQVETAMRNVLLHGVAPGTPA